MFAKGLPIFFAILLATLPSARAAEKEAREREAKRACLNGEVEAGVKILTDLYVDTNDPTYIFNQGRCYGQSSRYEQRCMCQAGPLLRWQLGSHDLCHRCRQHLVLLQQPSVRRNRST